MFRTGGAQEYWQSAGVLAERRSSGRAQDYWQSAGVLAARKIIGIAHRGGSGGFPPDARDGGRFFLRVLAFFVVFFAQKLLRVVFLFVGGCTLCGGLEFRKSEFEFVLSVQIYVTGDCAFFFLAERGGGEKA